MPKVSEQLIERLTAEGHIPEGATPTFQRLRPGHWQRAAGAWVWQVTYQWPGGGVGYVGSGDTATACLKATKLEPVGNDELVAEE